MTEEEKTMLFQKRKELVTDLAELYELRNDSIILEYALYDKSKKNQIELEVYRRIFSAYCHNQRETEWLSKPWTSFFYRLEQSIEWIAQGLNRMDIFQIIQQLGNLSIIIAVITFLVEIPQRQEKAVNEAWNVINSSNNNPDSFARINALQTLTKNKVLLDGISIPSANLRGVKLINASLKRANFSKSNLQNADFTNADLSGANLSDTDLSDAKLTGTKL